MTCHITALRQGVEGQALSGQTNIKQLASGPETEARLNISALGEHLLALQRQVAVQRQHRTPQSAARTQRKVTG